MLFDALAGHRCFDCQVQGTAPEGEPIMARRVGYVQHLDAARLQRLAEEHELTVAVTARPGAYVAPNRSLMLVTGQIDEDIAAELIGAFTLGGARTFDSDPRFGLVVLGEIAGKALSPGINDPGTAIDVIGTLVRVLYERDDEEVDKAPKYNRVSVAPLDPKDLIEDGFRPIARDGAGTIEVMQRLLVGLETLAAGSAELAEPAAEMARDAAERARIALTAPADLRALEKAAAFAG